MGDLEAYRTSSPLFTLTLPENNIFGVEPGVAQAVSEGYSFIIAPPPPGEYEHTGSTQLAGEPDPLVSTTTLVVQAPQVIDPPASTTPETTEPVESSPPPENNEAPDTTEAVGTTQSVGTTLPPTSVAVETTAPASASTPPG